MDLYASSSHGSHYVLSHMSLLTHGQQAGLYTYIYTCQVGLLRKPPFKRRTHDPRGSHNRRLCSLNVDTYRRAVPSVQCAYLPAHYAQLCTRYARVMCIGLHSHWPSVVAKVPTYVPMWHLCGQPLVAHCVYHCVANTEPLLTVWCLTVALCATTTGTIPTVYAPHTATVCTGFQYIP